MIANFSLRHFRFHLQPKTPLRLPALNKGNLIRGGTLLTKLNYFRVSTLEIADVETPSVAPPPGKSSLARLGISLPLTKLETLGRSVPSPTTPAFIL